MLICLTSGGGDNPTDHQFWHAVNFINGMFPTKPGGAWTYLYNIRHYYSKYDNQLLACLEHYYLSRSEVIDGWSVDIVLCENDFYSWLKENGITIRSGNGPVSAYTFLQWEAGMWGR